MESLPDAGDSSEALAGPPARRRGVTASIAGLEHAQDFVTIVVGVVLIVLAATLIVSGVISFVADAVRIAMIADPPTGDALVRVWDEVCDRGERGLLAWSLGAATPSARCYGEKLARNAKG